MTNTKRLFFFFYDPNRVDSKNGQLCASHSFFPFIPCLDLAFSLIGIVSTAINLLDTWLHYAAVYDGVSTCMQYLNGQYGAIDRVECVAEHLSK